MGILGDEDADVALPIAPFVLVKRCGERDVVGALSDVRSLPFEVDRRDSFYG